MAFVVLRVPRKFSPSSETFPDNIGSVRFDFLTRDRMTFMTSATFKRIPIVRVSWRNQRAESGDEDEGADHARRTIVIAIAAGMISQNIVSNSHFGSGLLGVR
jgi:hypothetical protein